MLGPTKVEAVANLIEVVNFDPTTALEPYQVMCPDCEGAGLVATKTNEETGELQNCDDVYCATCGNSGAIKLLGWSLAKMTPAFRANIQDIKHDAKGRIMLTFRNKDKAAQELRTMLGWDNPDAMYQRGADGRLLSPEESAAKLADLENSASTITREKIIAQMMALADDPSTSAAERINILRTVAQLKGFISETGATPPDAPPLEDYYNVEAV